MSNLLSLTSAQLKRAADLKDKIEALTEELTGILGTSSPAPKARRKMSAGARAKIAAAQKKRWAKTAQPAAKAPAKPMVKKSKMSAAGRARIAASAKARWAKAKAAGKTSL